MDLIAEVDAAWALRWPHLGPIAHEVRDDRDRWVRFHSLPESKQYADTEEEYAILLGRQHAILDSLGAPAELVVITAGWSGGATPEGRQREVEDAAPGTVWQTILYDDSDPPYFTYWHIYVALIARRPAVLDPLPRLVADERTAGVILAPPDLQWLVAPYPGGTDVTARTTRERDALCERHQGWLSPYL